MADNLEKKKDSEKYEQNENNERKTLRESFKDFFGSIIHKNTENLKKNAINSALDNLQVNVEKGLNIDDADKETKKELNDFFDEGRHELEIVDTKEEEELVEKLTTSSKFFKGRDPEIVAKIEESANEIYNDIKNWKEQKSPVARFLLKIVNWIIGTEK